MDKHKSDDDPVEDAPPLTWREYAIGVVLVIGLGIIVEMMMHPTIGNVFSNVTKPLAR